MSDHLSNEEYVRRLAIMYNEVMKLRKDEDYVVNQPQMDKLIKLLEFFLDSAKESEGKVEPVTLRPSEQRGDVTAEFLVFYIYGDKVKKFCNVLSACSAVSIDAKTTGEICISCTIPDVFVHK